MLGERREQTPAVLSAGGWGGGRRHRWHDAQTGGAQLPAGPASGAPYLGGNEMSSSYSLSLKTDSSLSNSKSCKKKQKKIESHFGLPPRGHREARGGGLSAAGTCNFRETRVAPAPALHITRAACRPPEGGPPGGAAGETRGTLQALLCEACSGLSPSAAGAGPTLPVLTGHTGPPRSAVATRCSRRGHWRRL